MCVCDLCLGGGERKWKNRGAHGNPATSAAWDISMGCPNDASRVILAVICGPDRRPPPEYWVGCTRDYLVHAFLYIFRSFVVIYIRSIVYIIMIDKVECYNKEHFH